MKGMKTIPRSKTKKETKMKKETAIRTLSKAVLALVVMTLASACGGATGDNFDPDPDPNPTPDPKDTKTVCEKACDNLDSCDIQILDGAGKAISNRDCVSGCRESGDVAFAKCLGDSSCKEIEDCFELPEPEPVSLEELSVQACDNMYACDATLGKDLSEAECAAIVVEIGDVALAGCLGESACRDLNACLEAPEPAPQPQPKPAPAPIQDDDPPTWQDLDNDLGDLGYDMPVYVW